MIFDLGVISELNYIYIEPITIVSHDKRKEFKK